MKGYGTRSDRGTPPTMHWAVGSSLLLVSRRCLYKASAQGWYGTSSGFKSFAMLPTYPGPGIHSPVMSGLPSAFFGAAAERFGLPSGVRGIPAVGYFNHCGAAPAANTNASNIGTAVIDDSP